MQPDMKLEKEMICSPVDCTDKVNFHSLLSVPSVLTAWHILKLHTCCYMICDLLLCISYLSLFVFVC